jgi:Holliday junction resolvasome RuvABC endonuclease subunit
MRFVTVDMSSKFLAYALWDDDSLVGFGKVFPSGSSDVAIGSVTGAVISEFKELGIQRVVYEGAFLGANVNVVKILSRTTGAMIGGFYQVGVREFGSIPPITWQTGIGVGKSPRVEVERLRKQYPDKSASWLKNKDRNNRKQLIVDYVNEKHGLQLSIDDNDVADAIGIGDYIWQQWTKG